jgi:hypothetical protein
MNHPFKMLFFFIVSASLAGCGNTKQEEPELKGIKIGELAPAGRRIQPQILQTTNIEAITFELPAENVKSLDGIWQILNAGTLRYTDPNGFAANGLRAAAGEFVALDKVKNMLKSAKAKKLSATALLMQNGQSEIITTARLNRKTNISYVFRQGIIKNVDVGPGILGLQVTARQSIGAQIFANVQVVPVISASTDGLAPELAAQLKANDLRFYSAGFNVMMKPGSFVVLAPSEYKPDDITTASRFFTRAGPKPAVLVLLLVCTSVL